LVGFSLFGEKMYRIIDTFNSYRAVMEKPSGMQSLEERK
jgi:hypothetical protein